MSGDTRLVLIVNHNPEIVLLLDQVVNDLGFESAVLANDSDWQTDGYPALLAYVNERAPQAVLFDLPPPYEEAAATLLRLIGESALADRQWVVLSTGGAALDVVARESGAATLAKPFDLDDLTVLLERATSPEPVAGGGTDAAHAAG
ncbi:MAG: hypothetical protein KC461_08265 [Dehalococcoidia bacterium]|nr:hypothetical protein [Dehalococcoidia bacterium]